MSLDALVRTGVALAHQITGDLQVVVEHEPWTGTDGYNKPTYGYVKKRKALVERKQRMVRTPTGEEVLSTCTVTILGTVKANGATGRQEPIDTRDRLTLPDDTTAKILSVEGLIDPTTERPYCYEVALG